MIEAAKADGRWDAAYERQRSAVVPDDLAAALADDENARSVFDSLGGSDRYALILRLLKARTAAARANQSLMSLSQLPHARTVRLTGDASFVHSRQQPEPAQL